MKRPKITARQLKEQLACTKINLDARIREAQAYLDRARDLRYSNDALLQDNARLQNTVAEQHEALKRAFANQNVLLQAVADYQKARQ